MSSLYLTNTMPAATRTVLTHTNGVNDSVFGFNRGWNDAVNGSSFWDDGGSYVSGDYYGTPVASAWSVADNSQTVLYYAIIFDEYFVGSRGFSSLNIQGPGFNRDFPPSGDSRWLYDPDNSENLINAAGAYWLWQEPYVAELFPSSGTMIWTFN